MANQVFAIEHTFQSAVAATADGTAMDVGGLAAVGISVEGITSATITFEGTLDDTNYYAVQVMNQNNGAVATTTAADGLFLAPVAGMSKFRARISTYVGGTITVLGKGVVHGSSLTLADVDIAATETVAVSTINSVSPQFDTTDHLAVSVYGKASAAGDKELLLDSSGHIQADVLTVPGALQGPGNPTVDSYAHAVVDLAASTGNQAIIAAPGTSKQLWIYGLFVMANTAAGTVKLEDTDGTALSGTMAVSDEGGWVLPLSGNFAMPWLKLVTNKGLSADTGACTVDGIVTYAIVSV